MKFYDYINYIKGNQTNKRRFEANRTSDALEFIHMYICGPFSMVALNGQQYFIMPHFLDMVTFISSMKIHSHWISLENYNAEVEN